MKILTRNRLIKKSMLLMIAAMLILVTACGNGEDENANPTIRLADGTWDSVKFHTAVAQFIIENGYDHPTRLIPGSTPAILTGIENGDIDVYMENWTDNLGEQYPEMIEKGDMIELGVNFDDNAQGWYVPTYVIEGDAERNIEPIAPDLKSVSDLPKYWEIFKDPEDPSKGRIYGGIAGWEVDETLSVKMETFELNETYNYFRPGSEAALNTSLVSAHEKGEPWVGYNWEPTWVSGKYEMTLLEEPEYTEERWANGFASAFPANTCTVNAHKDLPDKAPEVTEFLSNYQTNSTLISEALAQMEENDLSINQVATWFLQEHEDVWISWVPQDVADKVKAAL
ncbi:ABC transporter substrate-binding protein [Paenisporosarcina sp. TG20]|uniref:ABC transporter substrate-binding protein n=1 Tax=Paenisporosarcina sp. TG20 TaxID=1211706 RepID=UPI0002D85C06|nr:ABC transporter substrate-binding protein [Paenisporosarcina sp. TG20]